jgi:uncharacterized protein (TIGR00369 family)
MRDDGGYGMALGLTLNGKTNVLRDLWDRWRPLPAGRALFSRAVGLAAPYTGTIGATVVELAPGRAVVTMRDRRRIRNHLQSVHAVALANLAELTGNIALAYSLPDDARFIVAGMDLRYLKKARGTITGRCECPVPTSNERKEFVVPVSLHDESGDVVVQASLITLVGPKKAEELA